MQRRLINIIRLSNIGISFALCLAWLLAGPRPLAAQEQTDAIELAPPLAPPPATDESAAPKDPADARREQAIAEFTQKMKDANYPALFEQAAAEFNVPADVLKGIAFAETRWEQLTWPPGETASPDTGMPRPYGIMSLWDNDYFGHSLLQAAQLIGKSPDELKADPLQNMRGAAALLRKLYEETPKPADAQGDEIESWRKAIVKYCGIPQPELSEQHGLDVYSFMNQGYHQYGIEWPKHPVNLEPMRAEVARIQAEARAKLEAKLQAEETAHNQAVPSVASIKAAKPAPAQPETPAPAMVVPPSRASGWWMWLVALMVVAAAWVFLRPKGESAPPAKR